MKVLFITTMMLFSLTSFAGPGSNHSHGHGHSHDKPAVTEEKTVELGKVHIERLIKAQKLDESWKNASYNKSEKKKFGTRTEWVVTFDNEKGEKGKKLYIFLKLSGEFVAANFTGK